MGFILMLSGVVLLHGTYSKNYHSLFIEVIHILTKYVVTTHYIFWRACEKIIKNLPKSQLDIGALILNIIHYKTYEKCLHVNER